MEGRKPLCGSVMKGLSVYCSNWGDVSVAECLPGRFGFTQAPLSGRTSVLLGAR